MAPFGKMNILIGGMEMEKEDRDRGRPHLDPLEQATEALPKRDRYSREEAKETERLDHEEEVQAPKRLSYSEQLKRL